MSQVVQWKAQSIQLPVEAILREFVEETSGTYGGWRQRWVEVKPDPAPEGWTPEVFYRLLADNKAVLGEMEIRQENHEATRTMFRGLTINSGTKGRRVFREVRLETAVLRIFQNNGCFLVEAVFRMAGDIDGFELPSWVVDGQRTQAEVLSVLDKEAATTVQKGQQAKLNGLVQLQLGTRQ